MSEAFPPHLNFFKLSFCCSSIPLTKGTLYNTWALNDKISRHSGVNLEASVSAH